MRRRPTRLVVLAALTARCAGLVAPSRALTLKAPRLARRGAPLYAQVDEELQETVEKSGVEGGLFSIFTGDGDAKEKATTCVEINQCVGRAR